MCVGCIYFLLNLCNFTKYHQRILIFLGIILCVNILCFNYKNFTSILFTEQVLFKIFLYKLLFFLSNISFNLPIFLLFINIINNWLFGFKVQRFLILFIIICFETNFFEQYYEFDFFVKHINVNLINGLFLIHPIFLMILFILIYMYISVKYNVSHTNTIIYVKNIFLVKFLLINYTKRKLVNYLLTFSTLLVITGSWWAQQELNWGGWWVWDFIELVNFTIIMYFLYNYHSIKYWNKKIYYNIFSLFSLLFYTTYICSRYSLTPSIHNFLSNICFLQYDYIFVIILLPLYILWAKNFIFIIYEKTQLTYFLNKSYVFFNNFLFFAQNFGILIFFFYKLYSVEVYKEFIFLIQIYMLFIYCYLLFVKLHIKSSTYIIFIFFFNYFDFLFYNVISSLDTFWKKHKYLHYLIYMFVLAYILNLFLYMVISPNLINKCNKLKILLFFKIEHLSCNLTLTNFQKSFFLWNTFNLNLKNFFLNIEYDDISTVQTLNLFYCFDFYFMDMFLTFNCLNRNVDFYLFYNYLFVLFYINIILIYYVYKHFYNKKYLIFKKK